jgi:hypothetical protein
LFLKNRQVCRFLCEAWDSEPLPELVDEARGASLREISPDKVSSGGIGVRWDVVPAAITVALDAEMTRIVSVSLPDHGWLELAAVRMSF